MNSQVVFNGTPEDLQDMIFKAVGSIAENLRSIEIAGTRKHAYTVAEVAILIGYSEWTVREFIKKGRKDKKGNTRLLPKREITTGDYRVLPHELDAWLLFF
jgi:predicted transcriptional regulator